MLFELVELSFALLASASPVEGMPDHVAAEFPGGPDDTDPHRPGALWSDGSSVRVFIRFIPRGRLEQRRRSLGWSSSRTADLTNSLQIRTGATGLEPATSGVTGRRSNQLNYAPAREALYRRLGFSMGGDGIEPPTSCL